MTYYHQEHTTRGAMASLLIATWLLLFMPQAGAAEHTLLVHGDSLSAGFGLNHGEDWPSMLQKDLDTQQPNTWRVVNTSISGETTTGGLLRFEKILETYKPNIVVLELGANDGLRGGSLSTMRKNLASMINAAKAINARVLLIGMHIPPNYGTRYSNAFHQSFNTLAADQQVALMPFLLDEVALEDALMQDDGLHPTAQAQPIIATNVLKYLKPLLQQKQ